MKLICLVSLCATASCAAGTPRYSQSVFSAIYGDDLVSLKRLTKDCSAANVKGDHGTTALMYACSFGSPAAVKALLKAGAQVNTANELGATPLMLATTEPDKVKLLLQHGANVNAATRAGRTALMIAA